MIQVASFRVLIARIRGIVMWVITVYLNKKITMFEFDTEEEAREAFKSINCYKIISEIVYFNDPSLYFN
jgi:ArsR family metal-binding transcriptional regulator